ncbi:MAG: capsular polysaccharide biosynthesis protein [Cyclobacteriaceae bacterium]|nr:MAG: capsular polysaccharide biosynthesis protein [Cyclobacteriaceae bacterium]
MFAQFINRLTILPRWIIIILDTIIIGMSTLLGYLLRFNFNFDEITLFNLQAGLLLTISCGWVATLVTRSYAGIVRYTGIEDGLRIMYASLLSLGLAVVINLLYHYFNDRNLIPYSVLFIAFLTSFLFLFYYRLIVKTIFSYYKGEVVKKTNVVIFGAGSLGMITRTVLEADSESKFRVIAFVEDDYNKSGKVINGVKIFHSSELERVIDRNNVKELIIAVKDITNKRKNEIVESCLSRQIKVRIAPPTEKWVKGEFRIRQLKEVNINDLLGRDVIHLANEPLLQSLTRKDVLITGAAGSIGSELSRQLLDLRPSALTLVDQAESALFDLEQELRSINPLVKLNFFIADITNKARMDSIFSLSRPQLVFHAAAYKHVPVMESNPAEAVCTNILGTKIIADLAVQHKVEKFVMVSTDKAVNPTSVMGCTKRIAEIYVHALAGALDRWSGAKTQFITTRFGNVLGSTGSVIPVFRKQIESGGPVTVTHPEITRYFMTIPEACRLVLEAGAMGKGGEIFIFDMGSPVRIIDLAKKMIRLSGLEPGKDIDIVFTGLREGEKLHEELLGEEEDSLPTHHPKILKARVRHYDYDYVSDMIDLFNDLLHNQNEWKLLALMKEIVPEYNYKSKAAAMGEIDYLRL